MSEGSLRRGVATCVALTCGVFTSFLFTSCVPTPEAWHRLDLTSAPHMATPASSGATPVFELAGPGHVRPLRRGEKRPPATGAEVRGLRVKAGTALRFSLELGTEPLLTFVPLGAAGDPRQGGAACGFRYWATVEVEGMREEIAQARTSPRDAAALDAPGAMSPAAPAEVAVDLAPWAGQTVELELRVELDMESTTATTCPDAVWGSPAVWTRRPRNAAPPRPPAAPPNLVLIGIDTLRADALGAYGRAPSPSPNLDALAAESDLFLGAFSTFNATNPSFASILTGIYGKDHGVYDLLTPLPEDFPTLAERLAAAGYATAAIFATRHLGVPELGFGRGFEHRVVPRSELAAELAVSEAADWLARHDASSPHQPFFLWLHLFDPHTPHLPPQPFAEGYRPSQPSGLAVVDEWLPFRPPGPRPYARRWLGGHSDLYAGEIAYLDHHLGRLLEILRDRDAFESTVVAVVSDHGESLGEHEIYFRHTGLWDTTTHVPLMIRWPDRHGQGRRIDGLVQTLDLFSTLAKSAGLQPASGPGRDLRRVASGEVAPRRLVFAEHSQGYGAMVRDTSHLYIELEGHPQLPNGEALYDLEGDPEQLDNLAGQGSPVEERLATALERWRGLPKASSRSPVDLGEDELERLRALGYLDG